MTDDLTTELSLAELVNNYAEKFNKVIGADQHHVSSPLGAWMLLAFLSEKLDNPTVKEALGVDTVEAAEKLQSMMSSIPAPVAATIHGWINPDSVQRFAELMERTRFNEYLEVKFPTKKELDDWLTSTSKGILTEFPLEVDESFMGLFASVLATDVKWRKPLDIDDSPEESTWGVDTVLRENNGWNISLIVDDEHGTFFIHENRSADDLLVYSVIPANDVPAADTLRIANKIASGKTLTPARNIGIFPASLEKLAESSSVVSYIGQEYTSNSGTKVALSAWLPAWESENEFNVADESLGFKAAVSLDSEETLDAIQVTKAEYGAKGFKAAALTTVMVGRSAAFTKQYEIPAYEVRFNKPYAVVAVVDSAQSPWHKVPVFTGYIKEAVKA